MKNVTITLEATPWFSHIAADLGGLAKVIPEATGSADIAIGVTAAMAGAVRRQLSENIVRDRHRAAVGVDVRLGSSDACAVPGLGYARCS